MDNNCIFINIRHWDTGNKGKLKHTSVFVIVFYTKYNFRFEMRNPRCNIVNTLWWNVQNTIFSWFSEPKQSFHFIMISEFYFLHHIKVWTFKMVSRSVWGMLKKTRRRAKKETSQRWCWSIGYLFKHPFTNTWNYFNDAE